MGFLWSPMDLSSWQSVVAEELGPGFVSAVRELLVLGHLL